MAEFREVDMEKEKDKDKQTPLLFNRIAFSLALLIGFGLTLCGWPPPPRGMASVPSPEARTPKESTPQSPLGQAISDFPLRTIASNLAALIGFGLAFCGWVLYSTDWFPVVGGLLGLGGVFVWVSFLSNLIRDETKKELQGAFERRVLLLPRTWKVMTLATGVFLLGASFWGTLRFETYSDDRDRAIIVEPIEGAGGSSNTKAAQTQDAPEPHDLPAGAVRKRLVFTPWIGRQYLIRASDLPSRVATVSPFPFRTNIVVPGWFWNRRLVLLRLDNPTFSLTAKKSAQNSFKNAAASGIQRYKLVIFVDDIEIKTIQVYGGEPVWIGCDLASIPKEFEERWRRQGVSDPAIDLWLRPLAEPTISLETARTLRSEFRTEENELLASGTLDFGQQPQLAPREVILK